MTQTQHLDESTSFCCRTVYLENSLFNRLISLYISCKYFSIVFYLLTYNFTLQNLPDSQLTKTFYSQSTDIPVPEPMSVSGTTESAEDYDSDGEHYWFFFMVIVLLRRNQIQD